SSKRRTEKSAPRKYPTRISCAVPRADATSAFWPIRRWSARLRASKSTSDRATAERRHQGMGRIAWRVTPASSSAVEGPLDVFCRDRRARFSTFEQQDRAAETPNEVRLVGRCDCRHRAAFEQRQHEIRDDRERLRVERARRFVEQQDTRVRDE